MILNQNFDFYYGNEAEQFTFYRIPKMLFTDKRFSKISSDAKILYGLLLDRMSLSLKNGWLDSENKVYIYFTVEEVMEALNIGREKCAKIFSELDTKKGCGLILRKMQGLGKPAIIYVKKFHIGSESIVEADNNVEEEAPVNSEYECNIFEEEKDTDVLKFENRTSEDLEKADFLKSENRISGGTENQNLLKSENRTSGNSKIESQEFRKSNPNNTDNNKTDYSDTEYNPSYLISSNNKDSADVEDELLARKCYREFIIENIDYLNLCDRYGEEAMTGIVEMMVDTICSKKPYIFINSEEVIQESVKSIFLKLNSSHIEYVLDSLRQNKIKIRNIKSYLLTALYNSYSTIDHYYTAEASCDLK